MSNKKELVNKVRERVEPNSIEVLDIAVNSLDFFTAVCKCTDPNFKEYFEVGEDDAVFDGIWEHAFCIYEAYGLTREDIKKYAEGKIDKIEIYRSTTGKSEKNLSTESKKIHAHVTRPFEVLKVYYGPETHVILAEKVLEKLTKFSTVPVNIASPDYNRFDPTNAYFMLMDVLRKLELTDEEICDVIDWDPLLRCIFFIKKSTFNKFEEKCKNDGVDTEKMMVALIEQYVK